LHHNPQRTEPCRTDVYAAIYHCPRCLALLETPNYQWGAEVVCPVATCGAAFTAPRDDVLHRWEGDAQEGTTFLFPCPACGGDLRCDTLRDGLPTTGLIVVCTHADCLHCIEVPSGGSQVERLPGAMDPIQAVRTTAERRCPGCNNLVPANAVPCPMCGYPEVDAPIVL
jgi:hypothetical protein